MSLLTYLFVESTIGALRGPCPYRPAATRPAARLRAAAQAADSFAFLPFAARVAFAPACLRRFLALWRTLRAFLPGVVAAWSKRVSALLSLLVTLVGIV